jgi:hypothetical protein
MSAGAITVLLVLSILTVLVLAILRYLHKNKTSELADLLSDKGNQKVLLMQQNVRCFSMSAKNFSLIYQSGHLVLTDRHLLYSTWLTHRSLVIPLERVLHAGKKQLKKGILEKIFLRGDVELMWLEYMNDRRASETVTWAVNDAERWIEELGVEVTGQ